MKKYSFNMFNMFLVWCFLFFMLFFMGPGMAAQSPEQRESSSLVRDITLVEESPAKESAKEKNKEPLRPLPDHLSIGIDMKAGAFFKLSAVAAGSLSQGMNVIDIPVGGNDNLFERSGTHTYDLE